MDIFVFIVSTLYFPFLFSATEDNINVMNIGAKYTMMSKGLGAISISPPSFSQNLWRSTKILKRLIKLYQTSLRVYSKALLIRERKLLFNSFINQVSFIF